MLLNMSHWMKIVTNSNDKDDENKYYTMQQITSLYCVGNLRLKKECEKRFFPHTNIPNQIYEVMHA